MVFPARCPDCSYDLRGATVHDSCPECGLTFDLSDGCHIFRARDRYGFRSTLPVLVIGVVLSIVILTALFAALMPLLGEDHHLYEENWWRPMLIGSVGMFIALVLAGRVIFRHRMRSDWPLEFQIAGDGLHVVDTRSGKEVEHMPWRFIPRVMVSRSPSGSPSLQFGETGMFGLFVSKSWYELDCSHQQALQVKRAIGERMNRIVWGDAPKQQQTDES